MFDHTGCSVGARDGREAGLAQDFVKRGLIIFGKACAGDAATIQYCNAFLAAFAGALRELRNKGVTVNDPAEANSATSP